jgi:hypothetical protein
MPEDVATIAGAASTMAILFSVVALALAVVAWSKELRWGRVFTLCLAMGAVLWSLVVV